MIDNADIGDVSRQELEVQYQFQSSCLVMLVRRAGGTVTITEEDVDPEGKDVRLCYELLEGGDVRLSLETVDEQLLPPSIILLS